jgi:hypothetical protein
VRNSNKEQSSEQRKDKNEEEERNKTGEKRTSDYIHWHF